MGLYDSESSPMCNTCGGTLEIRNPTPSDPDQRVYVCTCCGQSPKNRETLQTFDLGMSYVLDAKEKKEWTF